MYLQSIRGSITVFMSMMLMLVASLLFTLLEGSRYRMLGMEAALNSQSITESMFAEYNVPAYDNYHLLMMDSGYGTGELKLSEIHARMQELGQVNLNPTVRGFGRYHNFLQMDVAESSIVRYELATDQHAAALLKQMAQVMKKELVTDAADKAVKKLIGIQESNEQGKKANHYLDGALTTMEQAKAAKQDQISTEYSLQADTADVMQDEQTWEQVENPVENPMENPVENPVDNPMEEIQSAKNSPLLAQVLTDGKGISAKQVTKEDAVDTRALNTGNYGESDTNGMIDRLLIVQYLKKYTANYLYEISMPHALSYEQEYILFGKYSDEANLKKMASRLLLIREGINFAYLMTDSAKREEALAMATAIAIATGVPAAAKAIQMGILASWAYAESIVELRTLFSGGKVAAVKSAGDWNISLAEVAAVPFQTSIKSREVKSGMNYQDYLFGFLLTESLEKIGNRFSNLLEKNIRLFAGYNQVKLDCMITAMETHHVYQAQQVFLTFVTIGRLSKEGYRYEETYPFSYVDQKDQQ